MQRSTPPTLGARVKTIRLERGWSQAYLGEIVDLDGSTISRIEKGEIAPKAGDASKLARALSVALDWLVDGAGDRRTASEVKRCPLCSLCDHPVGPTDTSALDAGALVHSQCLSRKRGW